MKSCIILCGGRSRRMGQDKGLMILDDERLIIRTLKIALETSEEIILVLRDENQCKLYRECVNDFKRQIHTHNLPIKLVIDIEMDQGPLVGLYTGLSNIKSDGALVLPCDSPFITTYFVNKMFELNNDSQARILAPIWPDGSTEPLHSYYSKECIPLIQKQLESGFRNVKSLFNEVDVDYINVEVLDPEKSSFINLNRPEDVSSSLRK